MQNTTSSSVEAPKQQYVITRRFNVRISGTIDRWNREGSLAATWSCANGKAGEIFGINDVFESTPDAGLAASVLQSSVLHKVTVLETKNDFPCNIGVTIPCIPSEELTDTGHRYAITTLPSSHNTTPCVCFSAAESETDGHAWRNKYPHYTAQNLEEHGVLAVAGQPFVFVSQTHPVIDLLRQNADLLSANIEEQPLIDGEWYKITRQVMSTCCQTLRNKVLNRVSTRDLNNFSVQLHRVGRSQWLTEADTAEDAELMSAIPHKVRCSGDQTRIGNAINGVLELPSSWMARLEVVYEINT